MLSRSASSRRTAFGRKRPEAPLVPRVEAPVARAGVGALLAAGVEDAVAVAEVLALSGCGLSLLPAAAPRLVPLGAALPRTMVGVEQVESGLLHWIEWMLSYDSEVE